MMSKQTASGETHGEHSPGTGKKRKAVKDIWGSDFSGFECVFLFMTAVSHISVSLQLR
jgi:hypothetical protein